jgi:hypothetical protein
MTWFARLLPPQPATHATATSSEAARLTGRLWS